MTLGLSSEKSAASSSTSWGTILLSGLVTLVVSVAGGMLIFFLQSRQPSLVYSSSETIPFQGESKVIAVYQVAVSNDGKLPVDDIAAYVAVPGASIDQKRVSADPSFSVRDTLENGALRLSIASLNPSETVQVSVLASAQGSLPPRAEVSLRAKGTKGHEKSPGSAASPLFLGFTTALGSALLPFLLVPFMMPLAKFLRRRLSVTGDGRHSDDQRQILAYVYRMNGLDAEANRLDNFPQKTTYWAESDRFSGNAITSGDPSLIRNAVETLTTLLDYCAMAETSEAIVTYNLARLHLSLGTVDTAKDCLKEALRKDKPLISRTISIDPILRDLPLT
jgi:hypothetical protein